MKMNRAYKFRLYPNKAQQQALQNHFGAVRFIYNHFLEKKIKVYKETKKTVPWNVLALELPKLKKQEEFAWLKEVNSMALQQAVIHLDKAFLNFFRSGFGFPKFKSKHRSKKSFCFPTYLKLDYEANRVQIPKFKKTKALDNRLKCKFSRKVEGTIKSATVSQDRDGRYYISILSELDVQVPEKKPVLRETSRGIDFGVKTFLTFDDGTKVENPMFLKRSQEKLAKHQQELVKFEKGTTRHKSKQEQITRLHSKIARQRKDFLDKLTSKMCNDSQVDTFCIEDLSIKDMQSENRHAMNRAIGDLAWDMFVTMLTYKAEQRSKNVIKIGRYVPSSKTCSNCGYVKHDLQLSDREWDCPECGQHHDRDINAAKNIKDFALPSMNFNKRVGSTLSNGNHLQ